MNQLFNMMGMMQNPQAIIRKMMNDERIKSNPMARNALEMYQNGDTDGLKAMAENLCTEKGIDLNKALNEIKSNFRL